MVEVPHEPSELQTFPPHELGPVQAMHCQSPLLQMGLGTLQSEFVWHPTQVPNRQMAVGALHWAFERQATQVFELPQYGVPPEHPEGQYPPPTTLQCAPSTG